MIDSFGILCVVIWLLELRAWLSVYLLPYFSTIVILSHNRPCIWRFVIEVHFFSRVSPGVSQGEAARKGLVTRVLISVAGGVSQGQPGGSPGLVLSLSTL